MSRGILNGLISGKGEANQPNGLEREGKNNNRWIAVNIYFDVHMDVFVTHCINISTQVLIIINVLTIKM